MRTLHLPLKAKWYEMIESGVKTEEYRILSAHWVQRLLEFAVGARMSRGIALEFAYKAEFLRDSTFNIRKFRVVKFSYGYTKRTMTFEIESITIGKGKPEWGAPTKDVFIIKLGKRVC